MRHLILLAQIDPAKALHDSWRAASPEVHIGTGGTGLGAFFAGVNWLAVLAAVATVVPIAFGVVMQCFKQYQLAAISIKEAQVESDDRIAARRAGERPRETPAAPGRVDRFSVPAPGNGA